MNKNEFFTILNKKLAILKENERRDIIDEYMNHIEFKIQDGKSEEEAIADFGDIDSLAQEILEAYHIDNHINNKHSLENYLKMFVSFINETTEKILNLSSKNLARILVEFIVILAVIVVITVPFNIIYSAMYEILSAIPFGILNPITILLKILLEICKFGLSILIIYNFIKIRILTRADSPKDTHDNTSATDNNDTAYENTKYENTYNDNNSTYSTPVHSPSIDDVPSSTDASDIISNINTADTPKGRKAKIKKKQEDKYTKKQFTNTINSGSDFILSLLLGLTKFFIFLILWIPLIVFTISMVILTIFLFVLLALSGIGFWGLCIILLGISIMCIASTLWLTGFIFGGKRKNA